MATKTPTTKKEADMAKDAGTAVAEAEKTAVVASMDFAADAGAGMENVDAQSVAIPYIVVLQGLSPQLETIEGAKPGMLCNTVTNELYTSLEAIPVSFQRKFLRWTPRAAGGGYKGELSVLEYERLKAEDKFTLSEKGFELYEGTEVKDTRIHFVMLVKDGVTSPAVISMASTQIKYSKRWLARIGGVQMKDSKGKAFNPPSFSHVYKFGSIKETNEKGTWHSFDINMIGQVESPEIYNSAREFHRQVMVGSVNVAPPENTDLSSAQEDDKF